MKLQTKNYLAFTAFITVIVLVSISCGLSSGTNTQENFPTATSSATNTPVLPTPTLDPSVNPVTATVAALLTQAAESTPLSTSTAFPTQLPVARNNPSGSLSYSFICITIPFGLATVLLAINFGLVIRRRQLRRLNAQASGDIVIKANRTVLEFTYNRSIWPFVESWAIDTKFKLVTPGESVRLYNKYRAPFLSRNVKISQIGDKVRIEAWIKEMFIEHDIESGGIYAVFPRKEARDTVNILLRMLEQPLIK